MTTYNRTVVQNATPYSAQAARNGRQEVYVDMTIDLGAVGNTYAIGDTFQCLQMPPGYSLTLAGVEVLRADTVGASGTLALKLNTTALGTASTVAATGFNASMASYTPVAPSNATSYLTLTNATGLVNCVVRVFALFNDLRYIPGTPVVVGTQTTPAGASAIQGIDPVLNYGTTLTYVL